MRLELAERAAVALCDLFSKVTLNIGFQFVPQRVLVHQLCAQFEIVVVT